MSRFQEGGQALARRLHIQVRHADLATKSAIDGMLSWFFGRGFRTFMMLLKSLNQTTEACR